jgi:putative spermidine/putrescine transport system permease protein
MRQDRGPVALKGFVALFIVFMLAPIVVVVVVSFSAQGFVSFPVRAFSLRWYHRIVEYRPFLDSLIVSLQLALVSTLAAALIAVPAALVIGRRRGAVADVIAGFILSPISMPLIVLGYALLFYLSWLGLGISFLGLAIAHTVVGVPYMLRTVLGVYRSQPRDYEEAAAILGANQLQTFAFVTLPLIRPGIFAGALFAILISLDNLPISYFFGSPATNTLPVVMLSYLEHQFDPSIAAIGTVQMVLAMIALAVVDRMYGLRRLNVT